MQNKHQHERLSKTFIIAEAGVNHNGNIELAKRMVDIAAEAGLDAIKFQTFKAENLVIPNLKKADYQIENTGTDESQFDMLKRLELSTAEYKELFYYCGEKGIVFISATFDEGNVDILDNLGMSIFKIPSGEITNKSLIQHTARKKKPIILSTGMSYLSEVKQAINWINEIWKELDEKPKLTLLHCVSDYPTAVSDVNLLAMKTMEKVFKLPIGFSDHTLGIEIPVAAVALGATVIEKHFTLDRSLPGPDHKASLQADELMAMVKAIRNVEKALGDGVKRPTKHENDMKEIVRKSLVATRDINAGETITRADIAIKRPGTGLPPELINRIINRKALVDIEKNSLFKQTYFC